MARLLATISMGVALPAGGLVTPTLPPWAEFGLASLILIILVVVGVNITARLAIPRVVGSVLPAPATSVNHLMGGPFVFGRGGFDWSSSEYPSDDWSSSWDYAGGDGPEGPEDDHRRFGGEQWFGGGGTPHAGRVGADRWRSGATGPTGPSGPDAPAGRSPEGRAG